MKKKLLCVCLAVSLLLGIFAMAPVARAASNMKSSDDLIAIIKEFEGFSGKPYLDSDGLYTIGYGTRCPADKVEQYMQTPMTEEEADAELRQAMSTYETAVNQFIDRHGLTYEQRQFDAVVSLVFNVGPSWLTKGSTLIKVLSNGSIGNELIYGFTIYSMSSGSRSIGHVKRRLAEADMYLNGNYSRTASENFAYVLYNGNGGSVSTYDVQGYDTTLTAKPIPTASRSGYEFKGWYTAATGGKQVAVLDESTKNVTLYAQWKSASGSTEPDPIVPSEPDDGIPDGTPITPVTVMLTGTSVNIRKGPGLSYDVTGSVNKGDKLTVSATHENDGYLWGKFDRGWIALEFTDYQKPCEHKYTESSRKEATCTATGKVTYTCGSCGDSYSETIPAKGHNYSAATCTAAQTCNNCGMTSGNALGHNYGSDGLCTRCGVKDPNYKPTNDITVTITKTYATIINTDSQNLRDTPDGEVCGTLKRGDKVEILEQKTVSGRLWGRCSKGWICLRTYAKLETVKETVKVTDLPDNLKAGSVTASKLIVRSGAGSGNSIVDYLYKGDTVVILETKTVETVTWGRIGENRWVSMKYINVFLVGQVTTSKLIVRSGASSSNSIVDYVYKGDTVVILETKTVGTIVWGRIGENRWISIRYVELLTDYQKPCEHKYTVSSRKEATCTVAGKVTYTCGSCGDSYSETIPAKGHNYSAATCTAAQTCNNCGMTSGNALGHNYGSDGLCTRCGVKDPNYKPTNDITVTITKTYATIINTDSQNLRDTPDGEVCGTLKRGDKVEILEQKTVSGLLWGRCSKGWICLRTNAKVETVKETVKVTDLPDNLKAGSVTASKLIVRSGAGSGNPIVDYLYKGDTVVILETKIVGTVTWGRIGENRWVSMKYINVFLVGQVTTSKLIVRSGASSSNSIVDYVYKGDTVVILEAKTVGTIVWGRIGENRWISIRYVELLTVGKVTSTKLIVRSGAGADNSIVDYLYKGDIVEILETKIIGTITWARIGENRWVSIRYVSKISGQVNTSKLIVRSGAGASNAIVGYVYKGEAVAILEIKKVDNVTWAKIGENRWVSIKYLK